MRISTDGPTGTTGPERPFHNRSFREIGLGSLVTLPGLLPCRTNCVNREASARGWPLAQDCSRWLRFAYPVQNGQASMISLDLTWIKVRMFETDSFTATDSFALPNGRLRAHESAARGNPAQSPALAAGLFIPVLFAAQRIKPESHTLLFALSVLAIVPLAGLLSHATESVAARTGDTVARNGRGLKVVPLHRHDGPAERAFSEWPPKLESERRKMPAAYRRK
jgi:hypothetical protein